MAVTGNEPISASNLRAACSALVARIDSLAERVTALEEDGGGVPPIAG